MNGLQSDNIKIDYVYDADGTHDGTAITMLDMKGYDGCLCIVTGCGTTIDGTNYVAAFKIVSNSSSTGTGTDHTVAKCVTTDGGTTTTLTGADMYGAATATAAAGVHDRFLALDIKTDQLTAGDRYVAAVTTKGGTLPINILYVRYKGDFNYKDMAWATRYNFQYNV